MRVTIFSCGQPANQSEVKTVEHLKNRLQSAPGEDEWILLPHLAFSVRHQLQADDIDLVVIGPPGVRVIEVKHWTSQWVESHADRVEQEADKVTMKARKIGTTLRKRYRDLPRVDGALLLTEESSKVKKIAGKVVRGVPFHPLNDWKAAIGFHLPHVLSPQWVKVLSQALAPKSMVAVDGSLRRLAGYVNLELRTPKDERFHRVYKGIHSARQDRVVLHLYDLSASDDRNAEAKAQREFEALHRLQLHPWAPRMLDSYQDAPGYAGEMFFFTVVDPAAPSIAERVSDSAWDTVSRLAYARSAVRALADLHQGGTAEDPMIHRNISPNTLLVKHDSSAIVTGFDRSKIPSEGSVASSGMPGGGWDATVAPEVRAQGLSAADHRSDIYSLSVSLSALFQDREDDANGKALEALGTGLTEDPAQRVSLEKLDKEFSKLLGDSVPPPPPPPARFWTEDQVFAFVTRIT